MTATKDERAKRDRAVKAAIHSAKLEGLVVSEATASDSAAYVAGKIDSAALVAKTRARYGLD